MKKRTKEDLKFKEEHLEEFKEIHRKSNSFERFEKTDIERAEIKEAKKNHKKDFGYE